MKTSLIIPFKNEKEYAKITMTKVFQFLTQQNVDFELIAVDDSTDGTWEILKSFAVSYPNVKLTKGGNPSGYGKALKKGFQQATGDILIPFNGDLCDSLEDVMTYIQLIKEKEYDMVFGSRFMKGAKVTDAGAVKGGISKVGNILIQVLFGAKCNDFTNSFKAYRKEVINEIQPKENGYQIILELALKSILKKYKYTTIPVQWTEREFGRSKMSILKSIPKYLNTVFKIRFS